MALSRTPLKYACAIKKGGASSTEYPYPAINCDMLFTFTFLRYTCKSIKRSSFSRDSFYDSAYICVHHTWRAMNVQCDICSEATESNWELQWPSREWVSAYGGSVRRGVCLGGCLPRSVCLRDVYLGGLPRGCLPRECLTRCKVIRVDTHTTNYKQSPTTINIDRPAHIKTDKQCRTHTTSTARLPDD